MPCGRWCQNPNYAFVLPEMPLESTSLTKSCNWCAPFGDPHDNLCQNPDHALLHSAATYRAGPSARRELVHRRQLAAIAVERSIVFSKDSTPAELISQLLADGVLLDEEKQDTGVSCRC